MKKIATARAVFQRGIEQGYSDEQMTSIVTLFIDHNQS